MRGIAVFVLLTALSATVNAQADEVPATTDAPANTAEAPAAGPAVAPAAAATNSADDEVECRSQPVTGSHMKKRVCMTHHDWELARQQAQSDLQRESTRQGNMRLTPK